MRQQMKAAASLAVLRYAGLAPPSSISSNTTGAPRTPARARTSPLWRPHVTYAACLALAVTLCAVGVSSAEDKAPLGNYEHLKQLEPLIGVWTMEFVAPEDRPTTNIKKGQKLTLTVTYKWDVNTNAILNHNTIGEPGSDPFWRSTWLIGWDTANKRIIAFSFESTGGHAVTHDWKIEGDKVTGKSTGSLPAGNKTAWTMVISDIKKDSCVWQLTDMTVDGKKEPGYHIKWPLKRAEAK